MNVVFECGVFAVWGFMRARKAYESQQISDTFHYLWLNVKYWQMIDKYL